MKRKADAEFRCGNWGRAAEGYEAALNMFRDQSGAFRATKGRDEAGRLVTTLHLNLSLAYAKCLKPQAALEYAEAALQRVDGLASNAVWEQRKKAHWRRGEALLALQCPERAVHDFVRVYAMEADAVQKKAYMSRVEGVVGMLAKMPERMGGVMRGLVDSVLHVPVGAGGEGGQVKEGGARMVVEEVEDIDELTMQEAAYLVVKEMEADGQKDDLESARGTCIRWLLHTQFGCRAENDDDSGANVGKNDDGDAFERLSVPEALVWRSRVCCKAKGYVQAREDAMGALRLLESNVDGWDTSSLVYRRLVVSGYVALGKALYAEAAFDGRDARRALKALRKAVLCAGIGESNSRLFDLVQEVTEGLTKEAVDSVEREVGAEGTVLDRVTGGVAENMYTASPNTMDCPETRVDGESEKHPMDTNTVEDVEVTFVFSGVSRGKLRTLTPFCREQLRVLVARSADVCVGKVGIEGVRALGEELVVRLRVGTQVSCEVVRERVADAYVQVSSAEVRQVRESLGEYLNIRAHTVREEARPRRAAQARAGTTEDTKAVIKAAKPQLQLALPFKEYKLVDAVGRPVERQQRHAFCMSRVYYDRSEMESTETWVELADGSCRWRQSGSEIRLIALLVPSDVQSKHMEVLFDPYEICVRNKATGDQYLQGRLHRGIIPGDCFWTHMGGEGEDGFLITMTKMNLEVLQKHWMHSEMWWSKLFDDHPDIAWDDYAKDYSDLPEEVMERHRIKEAQKEETRALESRDEKRRKRLAGEEERRKRTRMHRLGLLRDGAR